MPTHHGKFVAYYRVSTDKQGKSGLGLDAQKDTVRQRLDGGHWQLVEEFIEIESGKRIRRPQLDAAIVASKKHKAKLIVAKLDRLSRNVAFLLKLIDAGVEVLFVTARKFYRSLSVSSCVAFEHQHKRKAAQALCGGNSKGSSTFQSRLAE